MPTHFPAVLTHMMTMCGKFKVYSQFVGMVTKFGLLPAFTATMKQTLPDPEGIYKQFKFCNSLSIKPGANASYNQRVTHGIYLAYPSVSEYSIKLLAQYPERCYVKGLCEYSMTPL